MRADTEKQQEFRFSESSPYAISKTVGNGRLWFFQEIGKANIIKVSHTQETKTCLILCHTHNTAMKISVYQMPYLIGTEIILCVKGLWG